ncbi:MAG: CD225/dispanin family protein [Candidatus Saccharimonadaceae bacterium]
MENQFTPPPPPPPPQPHFPQRPKTWLVESILVTILCCLPFGIVGIINAAKVNSLYDQGMYDESIRVSKNAKRWTMYGLIAGIIYLIIVIIMMLAGGFSSMNFPGAEGLTF